jgi:AcrR family transcriptional regulator
MPKLKYETQVARRLHILDAAERCFARAGVHATSMHDICREAAVSSGALYVYFDSKEALIAGLAERERAEFADRFAELAAADDFLSALQRIGQHYFAEEPPHKRRVASELCLEATRNPRIGELFRAVDRFVLESFQTLFQRLADQGRIRPKLDIPTLAHVFVVMGDGMMWRRATDPEFDSSRTLPVFVAIVADLLQPITGPDIAPPRALADHERLS